MKRLVFLITFILFLTFLPILAYANEAGDKIYISIEDELSSFNDALPEYVKDFFPNEIFSGDFSSLTNGSIGEKSFLELASTYLVSGLNVVIKSFASILVLIIIISILHSLSSSFSNSSLQLVFSICSTLCISIAVFSICGIIVTNATEYMKILCSIMSAFTPLMLALLTMSGNISTAIISNGSMLLFINIIEGFLIAFMMPLTKMCLAFGCSKSINSDIDLSGISKTIKTTFTSVTVFVMSILMFVLSYKNVLSQGADTLSLKTARFAISSFVPLVGSSVNEALRTVTSSLSLIKNSCGVIALITIAVLMLPIIINIFLNKISFSILATMSRAIGGSKEASILEEADSVCGFVLTLVCCTCVLFIFALTIFLKISVGGA